MIEVLQDSRDLVFLHVLPTAAPDGDSPHLWEIAIERHNTNTSAELAHLFPEHHPHPLPQPELSDYLYRAPLELKRTPIPVVQQVLAQATRIRGQNPTPRVVTAYQAPLLRALLRPYMVREDLAQMDILRLPESSVEEHLDRDTEPSTAKAWVQALIIGYQRTFAVEGDH